MNVWLKVLRGTLRSDYNSGLNKDPHDKQWEMLIAQTKYEIDFDVCQN